jgi:hypothetical protein
MVDMYGGNEGGWILEGCESSTEAEIDRYLCDVLWRNRWIGAEFPALKVVEDIRSG